MATRKRTTTDADLGALRPDPKNARRRTDRNLGVIVGALQEIGPARSIVIDEANVVLAGNGTVEAAKRAGVKKLQIVDADGDTLIAVRRRNLTPEQKRRLSLLDNRAGELAEWSPAVLEELRRAGIPMSDLWTDDEMRALLAAEDEASPVEATVITRPTEVAWVLVGIPLEHWPENQAHVEALQNSAVFTTMVLRPKDKADGDHREENR